MHAGPSGAGACAGACAGRGVLPVLTEEGAYLVGPIGGFPHDVQSAVGETAHRNKQPGKRASAPVKHALSVIFLVAEQ